MRFGLIANLKREGARQAIDLFASWAENTRNELILCDDLTETAVGDLPTASLLQLADHVDILVSMGGDGTLLAAARVAGPLGTPVLGVNIGSLGFLTQLQPDRLKEALDAVVAGDYRIEERMVLKVGIEGKSRLESPYALNDVVIDNGPISRLIDITLLVNDEKVVTYRADGLILATPTGSTAYSLAAGGPIVHPSMQAILASPISSFSLSTRPIVFPADETIEVRIRSKHGVAGLTLDGQVSAPLLGDDRVIVTRADFAVKLVKFRGSSFYEVLKRKLHWGISPHSRH